MSDLVRIVADLHATAVAMDRPNRSRDLKGREFLGRPLDIGTRATDNGPATAATPDRERPWLARKTKQIARGITSAVPGAADHTAETSGNHEMRDEVRRIATDDQEVLEGSGRHHRVEAPSRVSLEARTSASILRYAGRNADRGRANRPAAPRVLAYPTHSHRSGTDMLISVGWV